MTSTYTTSNSLEKMDLNDKKNTWGDEVNVNMDIIDDALDGVVAKSATATLTDTDGAVSEAQARIISYTGSSNGTISIPATVKWYIVINSGTADCIVQVTGGGGTSVRVLPGCQDIVYCDGTDCSFVTPSPRPWTLVDTDTTTSGTDATITDADFDLDEYNEWFVEINGCSHAGAGSAGLRIGIKPTGGTPSSYETIGSFAAGDTVYGSIHFFTNDIKGDANVGTMVASASAFTGDDVLGSTAGIVRAFRGDATGGIEGLVIDFNGETFDAGSIKMYAR